MYVYSWSVFMEFNAMATAYLFQIKNYLHFPIPIASHAEMSVPMCSSVNTRRQPAPCHESHAGLYKENQMNLLAKEKEKK